MHLLCRAAGLTTVFCIIAIGIQEDDAEDDAEHAFKRSEECETVCQKNITVPQCGNLKMVRLSMYALMPVTVKFHSHVIFHDDLYSLRRLQITIGHVIVCWSINAALKIALSPNQAAQKVIKEELRG